MTNTTLLNRGFKLWNFALFLFALGLSSFFAPLIIINIAKILNIEPDMFYLGMLYIAFIGLIGLMILKER
jgi:hypothetical protein